MDGGIAADGQCRNQKGRGQYDVSAKWVKTGLTRGEEVRKLVIDDWLLVIGYFGNHQ